MQPAGLLAWMTVDAFPIPHMRQKWQWFNSSSKL